MIICSPRWQGARAGLLVPLSSQPDAYACKMRQSFACALVLCTAAAFAPQQHSARTTIKLHSSVKPSAGISFYDGLYEPDVPDVKLTRWRCSVHTPDTPPADAVAAQVQGRRERRRDVQF